MPTRWSARLRWTLLSCSATPHHRARRLTPTSFFRARPCRITTSFSDQQTAYYYDYAGQPWKTQELIRKILRLMYGSDKYGLAFPGMDDQGSTSSWYVFSAMGFYTVDPSSTAYLIGSPLFDEVTLHLGNGKDLSIQAKGNSEKNLYIQSATLNGHSWNKPWFSHADIANGGTFVFQMGSRPNPNWGCAPDAAPPSMTR